MCGGAHLELVDFSEVPAAFSIPSGSVGLVSDNLKIVVPDELVSAFKSSTGSSYQSYIIGKSDYTGEL